MYSHNERVRIKLQLILKLCEPEVDTHHIDLNFAQFGSIVSIKRLNDKNTKIADVDLQKLLKDVKVPLSYSSVYLSFGGL